MHSNDLLYGSNLHKQISNKYKDSCFRKIKKINSNDSFIIGKDYKISDINFRYEEYGFIETFHVDIYFNNTENQENIHFMCIEIFSETLFGLDHIEFEDLIEKEFTKCYKNSRMEKLKKYLDI